MTDSNSNGGCKDIEEEHPNGMNLLPIELAGDIISRLPIKSIIQFRLACKSWKKLSCDPVIVNKLLSNSLKKELECLIFHCSFFEKNSLYFVNLPDVADVWDKEKVSQFEIPFSCSMPRFKIVGSCNGILCLVESRSPNVIYVYNPFTRDYIMHEPPAFPSKNTIFGFGFDLGTNRYKVIRIVCYTSRPKFSEVQICCPGSYKWRSIGRTPYQFDRRFTPVLLNGRIHWIASHGFYRVIVSFDLSDEVFREVPGPPEISFSKSCRDINTLAILGGCLSIAAPLPPSVGCLDIWIMKEYCKKESWIKQFTIGRFLSNFEAGTYLPSLSQFLKDALDGRSLRVLCRLKSGKILLAYRGENLVCYDPESSVFNHITFHGLPNAFQTSLHVASLKWVNASSS